MNALKRCLVLPTLIILFPVVARADLAPDPEGSSFDGGCTCELICNGESLSFYQIEFHIDQDVGTTDEGVAQLACQAQAKRKRGLKTVKADITAIQATARFCKHGGDKASACPVDGACLEEKVACRATLPVAGGTF